jgi:hypothetical protein
MVVLEVDKISPEASQPMPVQLYVDIQGQSGTPIYQLESSARSVLSASTARPLFHSARGEARWSDRQCNSQACKSYLMLTAPAGTWTLRLRVAGVRPKDAVIPQKITVRIRALGSGSSSGCEGSLTPTSQILFTATFGDGGSISCLNWLTATV